jgi:hypothetical protein
MYGLKPVPFSDSNAIALSALKVMLLDSGDHWMVKTAW